jgi:hypothetical protein
MTETTPAWLAERLRREGEKVVAFFTPSYFKAFARAAPAQRKISR